MWLDEDDYLNWDTALTYTGPIVLMSSFVHISNGERKMWWVMTDVGLRCCTVNELDEFSYEVEQESA